MSRWDLNRVLKLFRRDAEVTPVAGDALVYQADTCEWQDLTVDFLPRNEWLQNGFVSRTDNALTFTNGTRTFDISPTGANFDYYLDGIRNTTTGDDIVISNVDGVHWVYYNDATGTLVEVVNPTHEQHEGLVEDECMVGMVYWNTNTAEGYLFDGRHGYLMSPVTHRVMHEALGILWARGIAVVDITTDQAGNNDTHSQFGNATGEVYDQDNEHIIAAVAGGGTYECWWWDGTRWQWDTNAGYPFLVGGTPQPQYNNFGAGTLVEGGNNNFVLTHLFASSAEDGNPIIIVGQAVYSTQNAAREGAATEISNLLIGNLPGDELKPIATVILGIRNAYTNTNNCITISVEGGHDYLDWRTNPVSPGGGTVTDHGSLADLVADDHHQYLLLAGRAGNQVAYGGIAAGEDIYVRSTPDGTKGTVFIADDGGDVLAGDNAQFNIEAGAGANTLVVDSNSRVGIGTAAPGQPLDVYAAAADLFARIYNSQANSQAAIIFQNDARQWIVGVDGNDDFRVLDNTGSVVPFLARDAATANSIVIETASVSLAVALDLNTNDVLDVGQLGVGTATPDGSSAVEISSTTGALLLPRMTTAQRNALTAVVGMVVYNTTTGDVEAYTTTGGPGWVAL